MLTAVAPTLAAVALNDEITSAEPIASIPYSNSQDTSDATTGSTDPDFCFGSADAATVWYTFTPSSSERLEANTFGSDYDTTLYVGVADGAGGIEVIDCNDDAQSLQSRIRFAGEAGITYLFVVGTCCGNAGGSGGGSLVFNLDVAPPVVPVSVSVTIDPTVRFDKAGSATVHGTLSCSGANWVDLYVALQQPVGRIQTIQGGLYLPLECVDQAWTAQITPNSGKFAGGSARALAFFEACGDEECTSGDVQAQVRLRR